MIGSKLFVISQRGRNQFWSCSAEHGSGWTDGPKQSFSPSELVKEIRRLIDEKWFTDIEVRELTLDYSCADKPTQCDSPMNKSSRRSCPMCGR